MKRKRSLLLVCIFMCCSLLACSSKEHTETQQKEHMQTGQENTGEETEYIYGNGNVIWSMQDVLAVIPEDNINLLNERLLADGYSCTLSIRYVTEKVNYYERLAELLETGETDIANFSFISFSNQKMGNASSMVSMGNVEELSGYLATEEGKKLWNAFYEEKWEASKLDDKLYFVPNQTLRANQTYLAFNKKYFTEEEVNAFSGDIQGLSKLLEGKSFEEGVAPIYWWDDIEKNAFMTGHLFYQGTLIELATGKVKNPYEVEEYKDSLQKLHALYQAGKLIELENRTERKNIVEERAFGIWLVGEIDLLLEEAREDVYLVKLPFAYQTTLQAPTGISKQAKNKEAALQLLTLLYTKEEYANLLIYGEEGKDYQVIDGLVCDMHGGDIRSFYRSYLTGLYYDVMPAAGDYIPVERRKCMDEFHYSEAKRTNPILGFRADTSSFDEKMLAVNSLVSASQYLWMEEDFEAAWQAAANAFIESNGEQVVAELARQIEEWKLR